MSNPTLDAAADEFLARQGHKPTTPAPVARTGLLTTPAGYGADTVDYLGTGEDVDDDRDTYLVQGLIPAGSPSMIVGPPKSKKSFITYYMAVCIAAGVSAFGRPTRRGRVLLISREDGRRETKRRLWQVARALGVDLRKLAAEGWLRVDATHSLFLDRPEDFEALTATMREFKPAALFVDSLSRVHCADENDRSAMATVTNLWNGLCTEFDCAVCILHHVVKWGDGKTLIQRIRGTGDLGALVRAVIGVEKESAEISRVETDGNLADLAGEFAVRFTDRVVEGAKRIELTAVALGTLKAQKTNAEVAEAREAVIQAFRDWSLYASATAVVKAAGKSKAIVLRVIKSLLDEGVIRRTSTGGLEALNLSLVVGSHEPIGSGSRS